MSPRVLAPRETDWERQWWDDEKEFTEALIEDLLSSQIQSKHEEGTKLIASRLSERRDITRVDDDQLHPHEPEAGRPDIAVYYEGDPLPRLHGRTLSNPFFIEVKVSRVTEELVQALRYKWRDGETPLQKYTGDCVAMAAPAFFISTETPGPGGDHRLFTTERQLWHTGLGMLRNGTLENEQLDATLPVGLLTFNEADVVVIRQHENE